ncbi:Uncharacterised protein [Streptococcus equi subsp. equi]|uniref:hypothetical protein n=1 Tax=Streptococcus equi TaxID=1336 RepID=UPI000657B575|nr:hypothetical protein [Streptococcus equi]CRU21700.1 Uncharacterised protein [Streptococcus equi subsp. equi]CRU56822.1 Uncharacterised protein [Streptococcus equi subsp. equi]CRU63590.1 Uncharacterised protein [Streptococcus equi subsp. equi]CRU64576.1 Uncharacterised protein [Streptococcus equi subsp. equi]CRU83591.1 Uncharacterised protein [Streptococcus equi subsp. equi]
MEKGFPEVIAWADVFHEDGKTELNSIAHYQDIHKLFVRLHLHNITPFKKYLITIEFFKSDNLDKSIYDGISELSLGADDVIYLGSDFNIISLELETNPTINLSGHYKLLITLMDENRHKLSDFQYYYYFS